jgi:hypothetical protein
VKASILACFELWQEDLKVRDRFLKYFYKNLARGWRALPIAGVNWFEKISI